MCAICSNFPVNGTRFVGSGRHLQRYHRTSGSHDGFGSGWQMLHIAAHRPDVDRHENYPELVSIRSYRDEIIKKSYKFYKCFLASSPGLHHPPSPRNAKRRRFSSRFRLRSHVVSWCGERLLGRGRAICHGMFQFFGVDERC